MEVKQRLCAKATNRNICLVVQADKLSSVVQVKYIPILVIQRQSPCSSMK